MTKQEREHLRAICEKATPGPWDSEDTEYVYARVPNGRPNGEYIAHFHCYAKPNSTDRKADAAFAAAARTAVPELLDEVERLEELLRRSIGAVEKLSESVDGEWGEGAAYDVTLGLEDEIREALGEK